MAWVQALEVLPQYLLIIQTSAEEQSSSARGGEKGFLGSPGGSWIWRS